ncbi:alpha/beta fold hydrolase [Lacrimispora algidixylanolytica]|uniref:AB hydrolase-1 domain-containing protein n=1 Tax=Lacrimispora algidixylanolytica TaxID=94868 RepID=A0A419T1K1_9FIRM|nr:alpha/beta hydrolase [Lacrimispora algidixylanolytica]RKD31347.1 hypothetical protein BET01_20740 [Lacrimispora algidixylanolytica]
MNNIIENDVNIVTKLVKSIKKIQSFIRESQQNLKLYAINIEDDNICFAEDEINIINNFLVLIGEKFNIVIPKFVWPIPENITGLDMSLSNFVNLSGNDWKRIVENQINVDILTYISVNKTENKEICKPDGLPEFQVFFSGNQENEAIIIIPPCAVPVDVFEPMIKELSKYYYTVIYENPYLFNLWRSLSEPTGNIEDEVAYIGTILQKPNIKHAHLIGICGGAPIAIRAAERFGDLVKSLIVCHGDLNFGSDVARTSFKREFASRLSYALRNTDSAEEVYSMFLDPLLLYGVEDELGPFIMYPYVNYNLFIRYAKINLALMEFDSTVSANSINQPVLIITSSDDRMAHPEGSYRFHQMIPNSELIITESGNHHDVMLENSKIYLNILKFLDELEGV